MSITSNTLRTPALWVIVPAAGIGSRMQADRPKQYLSIAGVTVIEQTLTRLLSYTRFSGVYVGLSKDDLYWPRVPELLKSSVSTFNGGGERVDTVLNGLYALESKAAPDDWVLVHDVARPCITHQDLDGLIDHLINDDVGGILGVPVTDTVKKVADCSIVDTVDRSLLWKAYTPQMFRYQTLKGALESAKSEHLVITDEASAIELAGFTPKMVSGRSDNIKITRQGDVELAEYYLSKQSGSSH